MKYLVSYIVVLLGVLVVLSSMTQMTSATADATRLNRWLMVALLLNVAACVAFWREDPSTAQIVAYLVAHAVLGLLVWIRAATRPVQETAS